MQYDTNIRTPAPRGHEIYNFGRPYLGHHYYMLSLSEPCLWVEKKIQLYTFYPQITSPWGWGSWNLQFLVSLSYRCYIINLINIGPVVLEKKMLTHDDWRQPIAIGHLLLRWPINEIIFVCKIFFSLCIQA